MRRCRREASTSSSPTVASASDVAAELASQRADLESDRGERCREVVGHGAQQSGLELLALAQRFDVRALAQQAFALEREREHLGHRLDRAAGRAGAQAQQHSDRLAAQEQRHQDVELGGAAGRDRALPAADGGGALDHVRRRLLAGPGEQPVAFEAVEHDSGGASAGRDQRLGGGVPERLHVVGARQQAHAQLVDRLDLGRSRLGARRLLTTARDQAAHQDGRGDERRQRDHVVAVREVKSAVLW